MAARLDTDRGTVARWRTRFLRDRLDGLSDEPRPGVPCTITDAQVEELVGCALWRRHRRVPRTGRSVSWPGGWGSRPRVCCGSGVPSGCSPGARAVVRRAGTTLPRTRRVLHTRRAEDRTRGLDQDLEREGPTLQADQNRRPDHRTHLPLLHPDLRTGTRAGGQVRCLPEGING
ncbi:helix-turn-helix domain-containing protein [Streptomyces sp. NPDC002758]